MKVQQRFMGLAAACVAALAVAQSAVAAEDAFPSKPLRIVVPVSPGGNLDLVTRAVAERMAAGLGQTIVVENRAGASSTLGTRFVKTSPPDGYTLIAMANTMLSTPALVSSAGYDPVADFAGVSLMARIPNVLVIPANSPTPTLNELIARAKAKPGEVSYASAGTGSVGHLAAERFARQAGVKLLHVPYKGNGPALVDVVGGRVAMMFDQVSTSGSHLKAGSLKAIGVTTASRSPLFPDIPTLDEAGMKGFEDMTFNALMAPAGTPREVIARLHAEVVKAVQGEIRNKFAAQGIELAASASPEEFHAYVKSETARFAKLVVDANIPKE